MTALTTLTVPARLERGREPAAGAVAADGLGHLAAAPGRPGRRGRVLGAVAVYVWIVGMQLHHAYAAATTCHPALSCLRRPDHQLQLHEPCPGRSATSAAGARADRGVRRGAGAGPRARDRDLPLRLDPGLRAVALDARQAGGARGRGDRRGRSDQRAVLLVLPAVLRHGQPCLSLSESRSLPPCSTCAGSRSPPGRWSPSPSAPWPACSSAGSSPRSSPPWPPTPGSPSWLRFLRQHYLTPLRTTNVNVPGSAWISQWWTKGGRRSPAGAPHLVQQCASGPARARSRSPSLCAVLRPARLHAVDQLPAGQPVLGVPVDRGRLAARPVGAAHRRDRVAGPPPRGLNDMTRARVGRQQPPGGIGAALLIGAVFGILPALRAAGMSPTKALWSP